MRCARSSPLFLKGQLGSPSMPEVNEIKNTLEATNRRITEAEDRISELEDRMVEINESERIKVPAPAPCHPALPRLPRSPHTAVRPGPLPMRRADSLEKTDAGRDWGQEEKGMPEYEMAGWHH